MSEETSDKVVAILSNLKKNQGSAMDLEDTADQSEVSSSTSQETTSKNTNDGAKQKSKEIRGMPKSGRFWKSTKERFATINKTKGLKQDFQKKTALRLELKRTKELSRQMQEEIKNKNQERKERRRENLKRAEENKKKSEVVQVITNTAKLKRMRKKQLRFIQKRDTNKEVEASK